MFWKECLFIASCPTDRIEKLALGDVKEALKQHIEKDPAFVIQRSNMSKAKQRDQQFSLFLLTSLRVSRNETHILTVSQMESAWMLMLLYII